MQNTEIEKGPEAFMNLALPIRNNFKGDISVHFDLDFQKEILGAVKERFDIMHERFLVSRNEVFLSKADGSLVSNFEQCVEVEIGNLLRELTSDTAILGEEGFNYSPTALSNTRWLIDPIDGTISFHNRLDTYAFCLTLLHEDKPIACLIYFPQLQKVFSAFHENGAFLNGVRLGVETREIPKKQIIAVSDDYTFLLAKRSDVLNRLRDSNHIVRNYTDIHGHTLVAEGKCCMKFDAACATWDRYPAELLAREAGLRTFFVPTNAHTEDFAGSLVVCHPQFAAEAKLLLFGSSAAIMEN